jgi:hypothetical protein
MKHRRKQSTFVTFAVNMPSKDKLLAFGTAHHVERPLLVVHGLFTHLPLQLFDQQLDV